MPISLPLTLFSIILSSPFFFFSPSLSDPRISEVEQICSGTGALSAIPNFGAVFRDVVLQVSNQSWGFSSVTNSPPIMYGLAQCHGDLDQNDCLLCYAQTRTKAPSCLPRMGRLYLDGCFLRFDNYSFFDETLDPSHDNFTCAPRAAGLTDAALFRDRVGRVVANLTTSAVAGKGFAVAKEEGGAVSAIYALAQCWGTVVQSGGCKACLDDAASKVKRCVPGGEGRAMNAGCFMRYSTQKFYNVPINDGSSHVGVIVAIALAAAASFSVLIIGVYVLYRRKSRQIQARKNPMRIPALLSNSSLAFKYELLEKATNFFDETRKLGQGGAGSVYKGILPDGKVVAVKRLVFNTRQWVDDFFNEVNLISGIQHKNLVKLLGCSIEGPESLLVYEYVPNRSLDQVLFVNNAVHVLSWSERLNVIVGTAEGLAYLHNDCGVKIIHRDIKTSNVLLDENLTAKIADFGLARCIAADNSHLSTGIAGTLGYMAPEYLVRGQLTEKADVYSFGVLVLEILCGRKNSVFAEGFGSVLQSVWKNYLSNCLHESMDIKLKGKFPEKEAAVVFQIGLLCTQASPELRPSMAQVVQLLKTKDDESAVPTPSQPPFLNAAALLSSDNSTQSSSTAISNQLSETSSSYTARSYGAPRKLFVPGVNEASENR